jgi:hypothetical protein
LKIADLKIEDCRLQITDCWNGRLLIADYRLQIVDYRLADYRLLESWEVAD